MSLRQIPLIKTMMSSVYALHLAFLLVLKMSFMRVINISGPKVLACGTVGQKVYWCLKVKSYKKLLLSVFKVMPY